MANDMFNSFMNVPDEKGRFGQFGGRFVSETLMPLILDLEAEYEKLNNVEIIKESIDKSMALANEEHIGVLNNLKEIKISLQKIAYQEPLYIFACYLNIFLCIIFSVWQTNRITL